MFCCLILLIMETIYHCKPLVHYVEIYVNYMSGTKQKMDKSWLKYDILYP